METSTARIFNNTFKNPNEQQIQTAKNLQCNNEYFLNILNGIEQGSPQLFEVSIERMDTEEIDAGKVEERVIESTTQLLSEHQSFIAIQKALRHSYKKIVQLFYEKFKKEVTEKVIMYYTKNHEARVAIAYHELSAANKALVLPVPPYADRNFILALKSDFSKDMIDFIAQRKNWGPTRALLKAFHEKFTLCYLPNKVLQDQFPYIKKRKEMIDDEQRLPILATVPHIEQNNDKLPDILTKITTGEKSSLLKSSKKEVNKSDSQIFELDESKYGNSRTKFVKCDESGNLRALNTFNRYFIISLIKIVYSNHEERQEQFCIESACKDEEQRLRLERKFEFEYLAEANRPLQPLVIEYVHAIQGYGVFVTKEIQERQLLAVYTGDSFIEKPSKSKPQDQWYAYEIQIEDSKEVLIVDAGKRGNVARFINHSRIPNVEVVLEYNKKGVIEIRYYAKRKIMPGEQLLSNYGEEYFSSKTEGGGYKCRMSQFYLNPDDNWQSPPYRYAKSLKSGISYCQPYEVIKDCLPLFRSRSYLVFTDLAKAVIKNDCNAVRELIEANVKCVEAPCYILDKDQQIATTQENITPLMLAAYFGASLDIIGILLEYADPDRCTLMSGFNALHLFMHHSSSDNQYIIKVTRLLLSKMNHPLICNSENKTALSIAIKSRNISALSEILDFTVEKNIDIFALYDLENPEDCCIQWCLQHGNTEVLYVLLLHIIFKASIGCSEDIINDVEDKIILTFEQIKSLKTPPQDLKEQLKIFAAFLSLGKDVWNDAPLPARKNFEILTNYKQKTKPRLKENFLFQHLEALYVKLFNRTLEVRGIDIKRIEIDVRRKKLLNNS